MTASVEVTIDAVDADPVVTFWQAALGYDRPVRARSVRRLGTAARATPGRAS